MAEVCSIKMILKCVFLVNKLLFFSLQGPQELNALSVCAVQYFTGEYTACATALMVRLNALKIKINSFLAVSFRLLCTLAS